MKSGILFTVLIAFIGLVPLAIAHDEGKHGAAKTTSLTGEVVDTGCYLAHEAKGPKHVDCANKCIANGMPMGLLTNGGALYLITLNHDDADPYNQLKEMAGKTVVVTGTVYERAGMKGIDVTGVKVASAQPAK